MPGPYTLWKRSRAALAPVVLAHAAVYCSWATLLTAYALRGSKGVSSSTTIGAVAWPQRGQSGSNRPAAKSAARRGPGRTGPCSAHRAMPSP
jgi:hypothetical protein